MSSYNIFMKIALSHIPHFQAWMKYLNKLTDHVHIINVHRTDLNEFLIQNNVKYLFPINYPDGDYLCLYTFDSSVTTCIMFTAKSHIDLLEDKINTIHFFLSNDLSHYLPKTYVVSINDDKTNYCGESLCYPVVVKPKYGACGQNVIICDNEDKLNEIIPNYNGDYAIQEYVDCSYEYSGYFICNKGKILASVFYGEHMSDIPYIKKTQFKKPTIEKLPLDDFESIFEVIGYTGFATINFKMINELLRVFEINPRLGGGIIEQGQLDLLFEQLE